MERPEYVDLEALHRARKILHERPPYFCDECGIVNPPHNFYPLGCSHRASDGSGSLSGMICNCCSGNCPYCKEGEDGPGTTSGV